MPVYEYKCKDHGVFFELATLADCDQPGACPECEQQSPRVVMLAPELFRMNKDLKHGHEVNEKNQHEPTFSNAERRDNDEEHRSGCGCEKSLSHSKMLYTAEGNKIFPSMRPWMISH